LLNETLFASLAQARVALGCWRADYNGSRPHSQLWMEDACRVRLHLPSAPGSGAALCPAPVAPPAQTDKPNSQGELRTG
jgi:putative transposase